MTQISHFPSSFELSYLINKFCTKSPCIFDRAGHLLITPWKH